MDTTTEYDEYRCSGCRKAIKNVAVRCKTCPKLFYHPGCVNKHKVYDKNRELVQCKGTLENFPVDETPKNSTPVAGSSSFNRDRFGSTGSNTASRVMSASANMEVKIDWLVKTVKDLKDEVACKKEVKIIIKEIVQEELGSMKSEIEEIKRMLQGGVLGPAREVTKTYSGAVKEKKKEKVIIIKPKEKQESEATKKTIKEKVDIKNMAVGVTRLKKGSNGTVILGCETTEETEKLKTIVQEKMGEGFKVTETMQQKPKIKIVNMETDELELADDELVETIKKQNAMEEIEGREMKIVKRINKEGRHEGSIIMIVDEGTHQELLMKGKISVGWRKCPVYNHINVKRCYKCWGYYHIAKNCTREETCHKCAGNHEASKCTAAENKCINCVFKNRAFNLEINTEHDALDRECPTYKRAIQEEKRRAGWDD